MIRHVLAAALVSAAFVAAPVQAATFTYPSGTRQVAINSVGPVGQSFVTTGGTLTSFGFQFGLLQAAPQTGEVTLQLRSGEGLTGALVATAVQQVNVTALRTLTWFDFAFSDVALTANQSYTAVLSTANTRLAIGFGPNSNSTADAYSAGRLISTSGPTSSFTGCANDVNSVCDANFRLTVEPAAAAIPEPATWATMLVGLFAVGYAARRRTRVAFAA